MNLDNFYKQKSKDGFHTYCKQCNKEQSIQWGVENRDKQLIAHQKYLRTPKGKAWLKRDAEKQKENRKDYRKNNKDKMKEYSKNRYSNKKHNITTQQWENCKKYFNHRCAYCGLAIEDHWIEFRGNIQLGDFHKEHVDDKGANDLSNCIPACKSCNSEKHDWLLDDWYNQTNTKYSDERFHKILKWLKEDYKAYL